MRRGREEIEDLKRIDLIAFLEGLGFSPRWYSGQRAMFSSPLRDEVNPSFYVQRSSDGSWSWKDWGTGESGDIIKFAQTYYGIDFKEALKRLGGSSESLRSSKVECAGNQIPNKTDADTSGWAKEFYGKEVVKMQSHKLEIVRDYFLNMGVKYHLETKCIHVQDRKDGKSYIGIPIPYPLKMRGLELREIGGNSKKTWGKKTLWLLRRDPRRMLITESILDALAGEIVLGDDSITLCSLNGVCNVGQLDALLNQYKPGEVILALDNDEPGRNATERAFKIALSHSVRVIEFRGHIEANVKDLHKLLRSKQEVRHERVDADRPKYDLSSMWRTPAFLS